MARLTFVSDLHLPPTAGDVLPHFRALTDELLARQSSGHQQELYVVGDLFSFWVDRPLVAKLFAEPIRALAELAAAGCRVTILEGNRDFGFGKTLSAATGAHLPGETVAFEHDGSQVLLMHGDQLMTFDRRYQVFKKVVRSWPARLAARWFPSPLLLWSVRRLERVSAREKTRKTPSQMRVDDQVVQRELAAASASVLIHGHTHEAGARQLGGDPGEFTVLSLGEWDACGGMIVDWPEGTPPRLVRWPPAE